MEDHFVLLINFSDSNVAFFSTICMLSEYFQFVVSEGCKVSPVVCSKVDFLLKLICTDNCSLLEPSLGQFRMSPSIPIRKVSLLR